MDVLWHEDKRPEREIVSLAGQVDRFAQPVARSLGGQEAMASIAGEGQLMGMAGLIIRPTMRSTGPGKTTTCHGPLAGDRLWVFHLQNELSCSGVYFCWVLGRSHD